MPAFSKLDEHPLVSQCVMYCLARDIEPTNISDKSFLLNAIYEYEGRFTDLNDTQRAAIAGAGA